MAQAHLSSDYPDANNPHWEYREGGLSAMFTTEYKLIKVFYELEGQWRETRTRLAPNGIPEDVLTYMQSNICDAFITYAGLVEDSQDQYYRIEAEYVDGVAINLLSPKGELLKEQWIKFTR